MTELKMEVLSSDLKVSTYDKDTMRVLADHAASQRFLEWNGIHYSVISFTTLDTDGNFATATLRYRGEVE